MDLSYRRPYCEETWYNTPWTHYRRLSLQIMKGQLISDVKRICDAEHNVTAMRLQEMIEGFFNQWYATWAFAIGGSSGKWFMRLSVL